jgi:hypothetical protein
MIYVITDTSYDPPQPTYTIKWVTPAHQPRSFRPVRCCRSWAVRYPSATCGRTALRCRASRMPRCSLRSIRSTAPGRTRPPSICRTREASCGGRWITGRRLDARSACTRRIASARTVTSWATPATRIVLPTPVTRAVYDPGAWLRRRRSGARARDTAGWLDAGGQGSRGGGRLCRTSASTAATRASAFMVRVQESLSPLRVGRKRVARICQPISLSRIKHHLDPDMSHLTTADQCDAHGLLVGETMVQEDPMEQGAWLLPPGCVLVALPTADASNQIAIFLDGAWHTHERPLPDPTLESVVADDAPPSTPHTFVPMPANKSATGEHEIALIVDGHWTVVADWRTRLICSRMEVNIALSSWGRRCRRRLAFRRTLADERWVAHLRCELRQRPEHRRLSQGFGVIAHGRAGRGSGFLAELRRQQDNES